MAGPEVAIDQQLRCASHSSAGGAHFILQERRRGMSTISLFGTLVETIKQHYELPEILHVYLLPSVRSHPAGLDSVYRLVTAHGSYVLRPFRTDVDAAISLHNQFLGWAERRAISFTQRIIETKTGGCFFQTEEGKWWLSSYIEAEPAFEWTKPTWPVEMCEQSGVALYRLHRALKQFGVESSAVSSSIASKNFDNSLCSGLVDRLAHALSDGHGSVGGDDAVIALVSNAVALIGRSGFSSESSLWRDANVNLEERQLIHGDFHPGNLLFSDGQAVAIIDFEYLSIEPPLYDLAYALIMFCTQWTQPAAQSQISNTDGAVDPAKLRSFLNGYLTDVSSGGSADALSFRADLLIPYMNVAAAICLTWFLERGLQTRTVQHFINVVKQLQNLSTMDVLRAIGETST